MLLALWLLICLLWKPAVLIFTIILFVIVPPEIAKSKEVSFGAIAGTCAIASFGFAVLWLGGLSSESDYAGFWIGLGKYATFSCGGVVTLWLIYKAFSLLFHKISKVQNRIEGERTKRKIERNNQKKMIAASKRIRKDNKEIEEKIRELNKLRATAINANDLVLSKNIVDLISTLSDSTLTTVLHSRINAEMKIIQNIEAIEKSIYEFAMAYKHIGNYSEFEKYNAIAQNNLSK